MSDDLVKDLRDGFVDFDDLEDAADRIEELESKLSLRTELHAECASLLEAAEAKLAKAVETLRLISTYHGYRLPSPQDIARTTLAELKGQDND